MGCRCTDSRSDLLRVVAVTDGHGAVVLQPDPGRRLPGRGAWLHPSTACFEHAVRRKAFGRALRLRAGADDAPVRAYLEGHAQSSTVGHDRTEGG